MMTVTVSAESEIRALFRTEFGVDLPLICGDGSAAKPFILDVETDAGSGAVAENLLSFSYRSQSLVTPAQAFWRLIENTSFEDGLQVYAIDVVKLENGEMKAFTVHHCFRNASLHPSTWQRCLVPQRRGDIVLPAKLEWFDFIRSTDYEPEKIGNGYSRTYAAPEADLTVYFYPFDNVTRTTDGERKIGIREQWELAVAEIENRYGPTEFFGAQMPPWLSNEAEVSSFSLQNGSQRSLLIIDHVAESYCKIRVTWTNDQRTPLVLQSVDYLGRLIQSQTATTHAGVGHVAG